MPPVNPTTTASFDPAKQQQQQQQQEEQRKASEGAAKDLLAKQQEERAQMVARQGEGTVKPTPTQEENDMTRLGHHVVEKEPDGSPEQNTTKQTEARHGGPGYQTRQSTAKEPSPAAKPTPTPTKGEA